LRAPVRGSAKRAASRGASQHSRPSLALGSLLRQVPGLRPSGKSGCEPASAKLKARYPLVVKTSRIAGRGVFAVRDIPWGRKIMRYAGTVIDDQEAEKRAAQGATAIMELGGGCNVDGFDGGNGAAWINHGRRRPNCFLLREQGDIWIVAGVEGISAGEELTYDYGSEYYPRRKRR
jgi:SET domain-containing protein